MIHNGTFIHITVTRGGTAQTIQFPENSTTKNKLVWLIVKLISPMKVCWVE